MRDLEPVSFMKAVTEMRHFIVTIERIPNQSARVGEDDRAKILSPLINELIGALTKVEARSALASAARLRLNIENGNSGLTYEAVRNTLLDIESRFADHLSDIKLFVLNWQEASLFGPADNVLGNQRPIEGFSRAYPNAAFEIEEAAKCIALERYTACVFHCMRALEHGIKALCALLGVPDVTKPAEKNWGAILKAIKERIDEKWPAKTRLPNTRGAKIEALYATLDAIKNPWRNATMHVESIYAPHEALHIARCTGVFLIELMKHCDEHGIVTEESPAQASVGEAIVETNTVAEPSTPLQPATEK
ncbi:hypothetical protein [Bradyrhizobium sp. AZCC 1721]|uniref:hypothetical protein n=1 Tax=Bradyrhizobium sp. AZCC 1721 TaxID=3117016 RepID=UPI002FEE8531